MSSVKYVSTESFRLRWPATCCWSMPRVVKVLVILAIRYTLLPLTFTASGRNASRSLAVWKLDHSVCFDEVTSIENAAVSYALFATIDSSSFWIFCTAFRKMG